MKKPRPKKNPAASDLSPAILLGILVIFILPYVGAYYYSQYLGWGDLGYLVFVLVCIPVAIVELILAALVTPLLVANHSINEKI